MYLGFCFIPLLCPQLIEFRLLFGIRRRIFLQTVKLCRQHIKVTVSGVFNLDIILFHALDRNFFNTLIDTQSVTFMHDKIADIQFVKTGYRLSVILFLLFTFFLPARKNIIFRNHDKLQKRILKALVQTAVSDHNRAIKHFIFKIFTEIRRQPQIRQILHNSRRTRSRIAHQDTLIPRTLIFF